MDEECTGQMAWRRTAAAEEGLTPPHNGTGGWDQPQERLKRHGADALKDCELMAIVLGTGYRGHAVLEVARAVVREHPCEQLISMDVGELA
jgi:DNA repair protein RadC